MIYLASPYTADPVNLFSRTQKLTARLLKHGHHIYSPIVHCHELAQQYDLPTDFKFWQAYNFDLLARADQIWVAWLDGWSKSKGVRGELSEACRLSKPWYLVDMTGRLHNPPTDWSNQ